MDLRSLRRTHAAVRSAFRGIRTTPLIFLASSGTLAAGLLLFGVYLLVLDNMRLVLDQAGDELKLVAFLPIGAAPKDGDRSRMLDEVQSIEGVASVRYVSPQEALDRLREALGAEQRLMEGVQANPLPASVEIQPESGRRSTDEVRVLADRIAKVSGVQEVRYGVEWVEGYTRVLRAVEWLGLLLGAFLIFVLGAMVVSTVRLAVHSREEELRIQRLVGAGTLFVRLPFYIEGLLQGALAAVAALGVLYGLYALGLPLLGEPLRFLVGRAELRFLGAGEMLLITLVGVGLAAGGAVVSLIQTDEKA